MDTIGFFQWFEGQCNLHAIALSSKLQEPEKKPIIGIHFWNFFDQMKLWTWKCVYTHIMLNMNDSDGF